LLDHEFRKLFQVSLRDILCDFGTGAGQFSSR
jgi:hypothetical protein